MSLRSRPAESLLVILENAGTERQWRILGTAVVLAPGVVVGSATVARLFGPIVSPAGRLVLVAALVCIAVPLLVGSRWLLVSDLEPESVRRLVAWSLAGSIPITTLALIVVGYQHANGVVLSDPWLVTVWVAGTGAIGGFLTGVYDVRRERERERSAYAENRFSAIVEASPVAVITIDDGVVQSWSSSAERLFGWSAEEIRGERYPLIPDDRREEYERHRQRVDNGYIIDGVETQRQRKDGALVDVSLWAAPITDVGESVTGHMIAFADIIDRKQREQQLAVLERVLRHDIRNTVNVIDGRGTYLAERLDDEAHSRSARRIVDRARRLERLSEKARDVTEVLRNADDSDDVDVAELVEQQCRRFERRQPDCTLLTAETETSLSHGSGIGLWAIHWLVRSLDGEVTISDREPHGAVVTMRLPRVAKA